MKRLLFPLLAAIALPNAVNAKSEVKNSLNMADMYFRMGEKGVACNAVSLAILEASFPEYMVRIQFLLKEKSKSRLIDVIQDFNETLTTCTTDKLGLVILNQ